MTATWTVQRTRDARFPWRIAIEQAGRPLFAVRAKAAWPGAGTQVFCLREREPDPGERLDEVECVPVAHLALPDVAGFGGDSESESFAGEVAGNEWPKRRPGRGTRIAGHG